MNLSLVKYATYSEKISKFSYPYVYLPIQIRINQNYFLTEMEEEEVLARIHDIIASIICVDDFKVVGNETVW